MRPFNRLGWKRKTEIIVPYEGFFAEHSRSYGRKKQTLPARLIWGGKIILQPISESLNDLND